MTASLRVRLPAAVLATLVCVSALLAFATPARAQAAGLAGGSDLPGNAVLSLPAGHEIPPTHFLFTDNPEPQPISVEFIAEAPAGITITPEQQSFTVGPRQRVDDHFGIRVDPTVQPGDYRVVVQLRRADIARTPGGVTNIPAIGIAFTIRVTGETADVVIGAYSKGTDNRIEGILTLNVLAPDGRPVEIARNRGTELRSRVSPGRYQAAYRLEDRVLATKDFDVAAGSTTQVRLDVDTVSFVVVDAKPIRDSDKVVVVDLVAGVHNQFAPLKGPVRIQVRVLFNDTETETVTLREVAALPLGDIDGRLSYRPAAGFNPGTYRFEFSLVSPDLTVHAAKTPMLTIEGSTSPVVAVGAVAGLAVIAAVAWFGLRRRRSRSR